MDRYLVHGPEYKAVRDAVARAVLERQPLVIGPALEVGGAHGCSVQRERASPLLGVQEAEGGVPAGDTPRWNSANAGRTRGAGGQPCGVWGLPRRSGQQVLRVRWWSWRPWRARCSHLLQGSPGRGVLALTPVSAVTPGVLVSGRTPGSRAPAWHVSWARLPWHWVGERRRRTPWVPRTSVLDQRGRGKRTGGDFRSFRRGSVTDAHRGHRDTLAGAGQPRGCCQTVVLRCRASPSGLVHAARVPRAQAPASP